MRNEGRFVVDTHIHATTLYKRIAKTNKIRLGMGYIFETYDNSSLCLYDMDRYGVDMGVLLPSWPGTTNKMQAMLADKYPDKFRACCSDQELRLKCAKGEAKWTLKAALEEVETALKTGKFVGVGEFLPADFTKGKIYGMRERLDEFRKICDLMAKYDVAVYTGTDHCRIADEYPDVPMIIMHGGYSASGYRDGPDLIRRACGMAANANVYLETGCWPAEYYEIPLKDLNVGATQLMWSGCDQGNCPQYHFSRQGTKYLAPTGSQFAATKFLFTPRYQTDWYGWSLFQVHKVRHMNLATQDELNLILGGNAAKIFKLPVPQPRMFPCGRPDINGIHWEKSIPFLPAEQIQNPDTPQPYEWDNLD